MEDDGEVHQAARVIQVGFGRPPWNSTASFNAHLASLVRNARSDKRPAGFPSRAWVARLDGVVAGVAVGRLLTPDEIPMNVRPLVAGKRVYALHQLAVHPDCEGNKISKALDAEREAHARELNADVLLSTTLNDVRAGHLAKNGFQPVLHLGPPGTQKIVEYLKWLT